MKLLSIPLLLAAIFSLVVPAHARFSAFVSVSPKSVKEKGFPSVTLKKSRGEYYTVKVSGFHKEGAWLFVAEKPVAPEEQNFREHVWSGKENSRIIERSQRLDLQVDDEGKHRKSVQINLHRSELVRAYVYLDHPEPVEDGGFYFTIDLPKFLEHSSQTNVPKPVQLKFEYLDEGKTPLALVEEVRSQREKSLRMVPPKPLSAKIIWLDLDGDNTKDVCISMRSSFFDDSGGQVRCYFTESFDRYRRVLVADVAARYVQLPSPNMKKHPNLIFITGGAVKSKPWTWDGERYRQENNVAD